MKTIFPCAYLAPVEYYARWVQSECPVVDIHENYQKQTYRSRARIGGANGTLDLNIPIVHAGRQTGHRPMAETATAVEFRWARQHFRSLETSYRTSPFFEYYEDHLRELYFGQDNTRLLDFNLRAHRMVCRLLGLDGEIETTSSYETDPQDALDLRGAFSPKAPCRADLPAYTQVFDDRFGFQENLSIADLLFCAGPDAPHYLRNVKLQPL